jgi:hypothetical protein
LQGDEAFNRLQENTEAQCKEEDAVEKSTKQLSTLPAKREILWGIAFLRDLEMGLKVSSRPKDAVSDMTSL